MMHLDGPDEDGDMFDMTSLANDAAANPQGVNHFQTHMSVTSSNTGWVLLISFVY